MFLTIFQQWSAEIALNDIARIEFVSYLESVPKALDAIGVVLTADEMIDDVGLAGWLPQLVETYCQAGAET